MRLRNITGSREMIAESEFTLKDPEQYKGHWSEVFGNSNPIHIEIGMGKGRFITELAALHPEINYIGIEKYSTVLVKAIEKRKKLELKNLWFLRFDAEYVRDLFEKGEVDRIYLNFSDPWPKDRHAKRRLTSACYLEKYASFLADGGYVEFKTDNLPLFEFSLEEAKTAGWDLSEVTYDLHASEYAEGNIMTEYEEKFSSLGNPILHLKTRPGRTQ